jgi:hypothetical protein
MRLDAENWSKPSFLRIYMPTWEARNLTKHYQERLRKDPGCFEDLLRIAGRQMTELEYDFRAEAAFDDAWGEYEGESRDVRNGTYTQLRAYFVDDDLVVAITDGFRNDFVTCFHEHFNYPHGVDPGAGATVGQKRLRYKEGLKIDEQGKFIRNLKRIRGFDV